MAYLDYGTLLKISGEFVNKNDDLFMERTDVVSIAYNDDNEKYTINGNYFVYAGDKDLLVCVYKCLFVIVSGDRVLYSQFNSDFIGETFIVNDVKFTLQRIDKEIQKSYFDYDIQDWEKEEYAYFHGEKNLKKWLYKRAKQSRRVVYKSYSQKFILSWEYKNDKYEVVFGYGIDPNEEVYNEIKHEYGYTNTEIEFIDKWFEN